MKGLREFIVGFSFSLVSVSLCGRLYFTDASGSVPNNFHTPAQIDLFKNSTTQQVPSAHLNLFATIEHHSFIKEAKADTLVGQIPQDTQTIDYTIDTPNDEEILSVNIDGVIPIEYTSNTPVSEHVEVLHFEDDDISAMLPPNIDSDMDFEESNPWKVAKGSKHIKNKQLLQELESKEIATTLNNSFDLTLEDNKEDSYRVAERIKSSLLFPIPNEILNDENLTPTFIKKASQTNKPSKKSSSVTPEPSTEPQKDLTIIPQQTMEETTDTSTTKGFLNNISSWFAQTEKEPAQPKAKKAPTYSSQGATQKIPEATTSNNDEFVNFYKTLQETSIAHQNNSIIPSELKLSFQPERAEISGQTLRWLKAFSEAAQNDDTYLQVRLDVSASTELQRKRLNLLYTIFMNNGVDFQKIDTVFSLTEPNAFIIRTLKVK